MGQFQTGGYCPKCGAKADPGDAYCVYCGAKLDDGGSDAGFRPTPPPPTPEPPAPEPKKKGSPVVRGLVTLLVVALAYFGGQQLGGQFAKSVDSGASKNAGGSKNAAMRAFTPIPTMTRAPLPTPIPTLTYAPLPTPLSEQAMNDLLKIPTQTPRSQSWHWNFLDATDAQVESCLYHFWYGSDSRTGAQCAFFCDADARRGGYYWWIVTDTSFKGSFAVGDLVERSETEIYVVSDEGEYIRLYMTLRKDGGIDFNFGSRDCINGSLLLTPNTTKKAEVLRRIMAYKRALNNMG